ncbi:MAG: hypothetical protein JOY59_05565, partial [Candidatus Eremiobacteraeota bacterium]|nr:hypothetical protein [Candidatus Eremiobacteraeota bacterium]
AIGFSSVFVEGPQQVPEIGYPDVVAFRGYAAKRREQHRREAQLCDRLCALALGIDRRALRSVGGFDERLGVWRWGLEDLTLRMQAAGYAIYVAEDLFVHRFAREVAEPLADVPDDERSRAAAFATKWGIRVQAAVDNAFDRRAAIARGFTRERDFIPFRPSTSTSGSTAPVAVTA